jgi:2-haloacid dehalogenase
MLELGGHEMSERLIGHAFSRRLALRGLCASAFMAALPISPGRGAERGKRPLKAIAFDGFAVFDAQPISALAEHLFPDHGQSLSGTWRTKIFEYTWLRTSAGRYADFAVCVDDALTFAVTSLKLELTNSGRRQLNAVYADLKAFPDILPALMELKAVGTRLVVLANPTPTMLANAIGNSGLQGIFDDVISTDRGMTYKPAPRAYQLAVDSLGLPREEIGFVASASWDATGSAWFGYESFWLNRLDLPPDQLGTTPRWVGRTMAEFLSFLRS